VFPIASEQALIALVHKVALLNWKIFQQHLLYYIISAGTQYFCCAI